MGSKVTLTPWVLSQALCWKPFLRQLASSDSSPPGTGISTPAVDRGSSTARGRSPVFPRELGSISDSGGLASSPQGSTSPGHSKVQEENCLGGAAAPRPRLSLPKVICPPGSQQRCTCTTPSVVPGCWLSKREGQAALFISDVFSTRQNPRAIQNWTLHPGPSPGRGSGPWVPG